MTKKGKPDPLDSRFRGNDRGEQYGAPGFPPEPVPAQAGTGMTDGANSKGAGFLDFAGRTNGVYTEPLDSRLRGNDKKYVRGNRRVPRPAKQDQRQSEAEPEGLAEPAGRQAAEGWGGYWKAQAPRPSAGRPQGCRATSGETGFFNYEL